MQTFEIKDTFVLDGKPFQIISGAIHYFRMVPEYWRDRLEKLAALGCNTVETYIPWNLHEPKKGCFDFSGNKDIVAFVRLAQELGLYAILRPSPYICAEWEFGGLPAWLLAEEGMRVRCSYAPFLRHVREYYQVLLPMLVPLQVSHGGNVLCMQIENEYGYYGDDKIYLQALEKMMRENGIDVPLFTSDGPWEDAFEAGRLDGVLQTGNFGSKTEQQFRVMQEKSKQPGPLMCMEFWVGWFDHWGSKVHCCSDSEENKKDLSDMLRLGNVNIYMFYGGTNFGFMNGSNYYGYLTPDTTSYDYDALLTEDGRITDKYRCFQKIIRSHRGLPACEWQSEISSKAYGSFTVKEKVSLFAVLEDIGEKHESLVPKSMERLGQNYGYTLYRSTLQGIQRIQKLKLGEAADRANIFIGQAPVAVAYDRELLEEISMDVPYQKGENLDILVENMGRVNYGPLLDRQRKGIDGYVQVNGYQHFGWDIYTLPMEHVDRIDFSKEYVENTPAFYQFDVTVEEPGDTFLDFQGWGKGCVFVNGFPLGRFWEVGPQRRLYLPGPLLKKGSNEIILFETDGKAAESITFCAEPDLGPKGK